MQLKKIQLSLLLSLLCSHFLIGQNSLEISGKVTDLYNNPLAYANIFIVESSHTTTTNANGEFILKYPSHFANKDLVIFSIGYDAFLFNLSESVRHINTQLKPSTYGSKAIHANKLFAKNLIETAISKIPTNHFRQSVTQKGFYQGITYYNDELIQLDEHVLKFSLSPEKYKYQSGKYVSSSRSRYIKDEKRYKELVENAGFKFEIGMNPKSVLDYDIAASQAGHVLMSNKNRKHQQFIVSAKDNLFGRSVWVIDIIPNSTNGREGTIILDEETLAFVNIAWQYTSQYLTEGRAIPFAARVALNLIKVKPNLKKIAEEVRYRPLGDQWVLSQISSTYDLNIKKKDQESRVSMKHVFQVNESAWNRNGDVVKKQALKKIEVYELKDLTDNYWGNMNMIKLTAQNKKRIQQIIKAHVID